MASGYGVVGLNPSIGAQRGKVTSYGVVGLKPKKEKERGGVVGFFEHLGEDLRDAAVGLPMGVVNLATHPVRTGEQMAKSTWHNWSPLFSGDFNRFKDQFLEHPLAPMLDILAVGSLGLGAAGKAGEVGALGSRMQKLATRQDLKVEIEGMPTMHRALSRRSGARLRQNLVAETRGRAHPWLSNEKLYQKLSEKDAIRAQFGINARMDQLGKAYAGLSDPVKQSEVMGHMYSQIRQGSARRMKVKELTDFKPPKGYTFVTELKNPNQFDVTATPTARGGGNFLKELRAVDQRFTTNDLTQAAKAAGGKEVLVVPSRAVRAYSEEAARSASFLRKAYDKPTRIWRAAVLNLRPAYFVNNALGNSFMYMMNQGDLTGARAFVDSLHQVKGKAAVDRLDHWLDKNFGYEVVNTLADSLDGPGRGRVGGEGRLGAVVSGVMPATQKMDRFFRRTLINAEMRRLPEIQKMMKGGMTFDKAAAKLLRDKPQVKARVIEHAHNTLGDYVAMSKLDRQIRDLIPFWAWDKTIARHTGKLLDEQPLKAAGLAELSNTGVEATEEALGAIPHFLKGVIPLPGNFGKTAPGRLDILTTQGMNPYATIPDLADAVRAGVTGGGPSGASESIGALLGPIPQVAVGALTGTKMSGAPVPDKGLGPIGNSLRDLVVNLPPAQLIAATTGNLPPSETISSRTGERRQKLYQKDWESVMSSWFGLPTRKLSPQAAYELARKEEERRKKLGEEAR